MPKKYWLLVVCVAAVLLAAVSMFSVRSRPASVGSAPVTQESRGDGSPDIDSVIGNITITPIGPAPKGKPQAPDEELLEESLNKLKKGNLAYSTPEQMKVGQTEHVTARIGSPALSVEALKSELPAGKDRAIDTTVTPVSPRMKMELKSADFDITPLSSEEQAVGGDTPTTWEWDIGAKRPGKLRLHLAAVVELKNLSRDFTSIDRDITVQVDPVDAVSGFVKANWQWIIATMTAIGGALWKFLKDRKKPEGPNPGLAGS
jgi:hypothetical protein